MKTKHANYKNLGPILIIIALLFLVGILSEPKEDDPFVAESFESNSAHQSAVFSSEAYEDFSVPDEEKVNSSTSDGHTTTDNSSLLPPSGEPGSSSPAPSYFSVHFIDVGQADSALVLCDGKAMLIDGGNISDSGTLYSYLKKLKITTLDYVVATHPHEDHVGGLAGALNYAKATTVYCPVTEYESEAFENFVKYTNKHGTTLTVPQVGEAFNLGSASVKILGCNSAEDPNNSSIVLKITYGATSFLFTGDAEAEAERIILDSGADLSSTVLKIGHHGSDSSTSYRFLREVMPDYAIISVGADNTYGHPTETVLSRLRDAEVKVFRTDLQGTVICKSDGESLSFTVEKAADADTLAPQSSHTASGSSPTDEPAKDDDKAQNYVLNTNTKKFHYPSCSSTKDIKKENKKHFYGSRNELFETGYAPCGNCKP